jgi:hypothetical protein
MGMAQMAAQEVVQSVVPTVNVVGEASIEATPTLVNISVSIEGEGKDAKLLRQENGEKLAKVIQAINKEEVPMKNFQTDYVSLYKNYDYNTKTYQYRISQTVKIKLDNLAKYETLMDALFEAGVNQINSVTFGIEDSVRAKLQQEARIAAIDDARKKALLYATSLDQNIGKALTIRETSLRDTPASVMIRGAAPSNTTLALGSISVNSQIIVTFELTK